jgi:alpha-mannosidase
MKKPKVRLKSFGKTFIALLSVVSVLAAVVVAFSVMLRRTEAQPAPSASSARARSAPTQEEAAPKPATTPKAATTVDLTKQPTLFVVGYAHLDTEWRWEYPQVIDEYLSKTMRTNFYLFDKYPHYIFNFTGANRFMIMKEYFPADYAKLKHYVEIGRWFPAGSSMEENDVNSPSAESVIRQVLYGNEFFRHEFGKASEEYMLPDCFGFPASLPSILVHAGVKGFSTQKLNAAWQPAPHVGGSDSPEKTPEGIPFNVGIWEGTDGKTIIAAVNPGSYGDGVYTDLTKNNPPPAGTRRGGGGYVWDWPDRVNLNGKVTGLFTDYHYVGTGDIGGAPPEDSVKLMEAIETKGTAVLPSPQSIISEERQPAGATGPKVKVGDGPLHVTWSDADQMFRDIKSSETGRLPRYKGDLELINHSAGSITSQAYHKRWNRENEILGASAEEASVAATWLGGRPLSLGKTQSRLAAGDGRPVSRHHGRHRYSEVL